MTVSYTVTDVNAAQAPSVEPDTGPDRLAMTRLLFGIRDVHAPITRQHPFVSAVLPFKFYLCWIEGS